MVAMRAGPRYAVWPNSVITASARSKISAKQAEVMTVDSAIMPRGATSKPWFIAMMWKAPSSFPSLRTADDRGARSLK